MKSEISKILIIPNYENIQINIENKFKEILNNFNGLIFFSWEQFYSNNEITFKQYYDSIEDFLKKNSDESTIIIAESLSAAIVNSIDCKFFKKILISPIFSKSFVNPYTTNIPSYKPTKKDFILKMQKEYFLEPINHQNWDKKYLNDYNFYILHYNLFDSIIAQFSIYENLKKIHKLETKNLKNTYILHGIYDKQSIFKKVWKYSNKYNIKLFPFELSSQHLIDEEYKKFKTIINQIIIN